MSDLPLARHVDFSKYLAININMMGSVNPDAVLSWWESAHQRLSEDLRSRFKARKELVEICRYPESSIKAAVKKHKKLFDILSELRNPNLNRNKKSQKSRRPNSIHAATRTSAQSLQRSAPSPYVGGSYSATVENCSQCGGLINVAMAGSHTCRS